MEWPSRTVLQGGIFHSTKVQYSPDTRQFLKTLIEESKLTTAQRQKVNYSLRTGEPLPPLRSKSETHTQKEAKILIRPGSSKRRSFNTILNSGAYEREKFVPLHPRVDTEKIKKHCQDHMAFGKDVEPTPRRIKFKERKVASPKEINRFDQLLQEIRDRQIWLHEMEELGEAHKHRHVIEQQIEARLHEIENLKINSPTTSSGNSDNI